MGSSSTIAKPENGVMRIAIKDLGAHVATLEAELRSVSAIELMSGDTVVAKIYPKQPVQTMSRKQVETPDFMARLRKIYGDKPLNVDTTAWIDEEREDRL